jgi:glycerol-3-phosphate O-acyltransferase
MRDTAEDSVPTLFLVQAETPQERQIIARWLTEQLESQPETPRFVLALDDDRLHETLAGEENLLVSPLRVVWLPAAEDEKPLSKVRARVARAGAKLARPAAQRLILNRRPESAQVLAAEPATVNELRKRWQGVAGFEDFVRRQAVLALDRAERALIGSQYKVARYVVEEITASPSSTSRPKTSRSGRWPRWIRWLPPRAAGRSTPGTGSAATSPGPTG